MAKKSFILGMLGLFLVFGMAVLSGCATTEAPQVDYSEIVDVPDISKDDLFVKTNLWAVGYFNKADSVIEYSDKEAGTISGKFVGKNHSIKGGMGGSQAVRSIFTVSVKDGKVKLDLKPVGFITYDGYGRRFDGYAAIVKEADIVADYNETLESLKQALTKGSDW